MEPESSPRRADQTTLAWPNPPSGSAGLCFGALAQAQLLCRVLGGCFLLGEGALLLGRLRDALEVGKAQGCLCLRGVCSSASGSVGR